MIPQRKKTWNFHQPGPDYPPHILIKLTFLVTVLPMAIGTELWFSNKENKRVVDWGWLKIAGQTSLDPGIQMEHNHFAPH